MCWGSEKMKGDFKLNVVCPSCNKSISVVAGVQDGKCPECGQQIPQLMLFLGKQEKESVETSISISREEDRHTSKKEAKCAAEPGSIITVDNESGKLYVVIKRKNEKYICMRIIAEKGRTLNPRYVHKLDDENLVLLDGVRTVNRNEIVAVVDSCSIDALELLNREYERRLKRAKVKVKQTQKKTNPNPVDNGMNQGNAWNGIKSVQGYIKVFRG